MVRKLYRVYYTTYFDEKHAEVIKRLKETYGKVVDHPSKVLPEFRYVEVLVDKEGLEDEIKDIVSSIIGSKNVKVDWIDTSK